MKPIPIELTYDRISNENLIKFSKSMKTLEDTILSLISRIDENGLKKLKEIVDTMSTFKIADQRTRVDCQIGEVESLKKVADSIESEFSEVIQLSDEVEDSIAKCEVSIANMENMVYNGNEDGFLNQYDRILALFNDEDWNPNGLRPRLITDDPSQKQQSEPPPSIPTSGKEKTYYPDNAAFLYCSYNGGCLQLYRTKAALDNLLGIHTDNVYIEQAHKKTGDFTYWGEVNTYRLWFDYKNKLQDSSLLNADNFLFVCIQVEKNYGKWNDIIQSVGAIVKNRPNCRIFAIIDAKDVPSQFIQSLKNPSLVWYSTSDVHTSSKRFNKQTLEGGLFGSHLGGSVINSLLSLIYSGHSYVALNYNALFERVKEHASTIGGTYIPFRNGDLFATAVNGFNQNTRFMT